MSRKPHRVFTNKFFRIKAKDVKKGDVINVGGIGMRVRSNENTHFNGLRALTCRAFRDSSTITLTLPSKIKVSVTTPETKILKK